MMPGVRKMRACAGFVSLSRSSYSKTDRRKASGYSCRRATRRAVRTVEGQENFWRECADIVLASRDLALLGVGFDYARADELATHNGLSPVRYELMRTLPLVQGRPSPSRGPGAPQCRTPLCLAAARSRR